MVARTVRGATSADGVEERSRSGQEYPLHVFNVQGQKHVEVGGVRVGILRSSDMRRDEGTARPGTRLPPALMFGARNRRHQQGTRPACACRLHQVDADFSIVCHTLEILQQRK